MNIIELTGITFSYGDDEPAVFRDFDLSIEKGKCVSIEGDNGAGKTTLFRILNGLSFAQKGRYVFDGTEITEKYLKNNRNSKLFHRRAGYLFQDPDIMLFNADVYDEIAFGPRQLGLPEAEIKARTEDCVRLFGLEALTGKAPYHLSGGQKKRVALAAVMALNPDVLMLDEPYAGLDRNSQDMLTGFLAELKTAGKTLLIATHDPVVREKLADDMLVLRAPSAE